jgi:hypothetical protein
VTPFELDLGVERGGDREALLVEEGRLAGDLGEVFLDAPAGGIVGQRAQQRVEAGQPLHQHPYEQLVLAPEVLVEGGLGAAGGPGDLLGGGPGETEGEHQLVGRVEYAFPGRDGRDGLGGPGGRGGRGGRFLLHGCQGFHESAGAG